MARPEKVFIVSCLLDDEIKKEEYGIAELLSVYTPSVVVHLDALAIGQLDPTAIYVFRCLFGNSGTVERKDMPVIYAHLNFHKIPYINVFNGKGDQQGKTYLPELYKKGYEVVPTFDTPQAAIEFPAKEYILKPLAGGSSKGQIHLGRSELLSREADSKYVIQPKLNLTYETSYFFIDNKYQYALKTRAHRWDMVMHDASPKEIELAEKFVTWNPIKGIQRVDCMWTQDGQQLMLELEDWCPYLSLYETENVPYQKFVQNLAVCLGIA